MDFLHDLILEAIKAGALIAAALIAANAGRRGRQPLVRNGTGSSRTRRLPSRSRDSVTPGVVAAAAEAEVRSGQRTV